MKKILILGTDENGKAILGNCRDKKQITESVTESQRNRVVSVGEYRYYIEYSIINIGDYHINNIGGISKCQDTMDMANCEFWKLPKVVSSSDPALISDGVKPLSETEPCKECHCIPGHSIDCSLYAADESAKGCPFDEKAFNPNPPTVDVSELIISSADSPFIVNIDADHGTDFYVEPTQPDSDNWMDVATRPEQAEVNFKYELKLCDHPVHEKEDYHDNSVICHKCEKVIFQNGKETSWFKTAKYRSPSKSDSVTPTRSSEAWSVEQGKYYSGFDKPYYEMHRQIDSIVSEMGWKGLYFALFQYQKKCVKSNYILYSIEDWKQKDTKNNNAQSETSQLKAQNEEMRAALEIIASAEWLANGAGQKIAGEALSKHLKQ